MKKFCFVLVLAIIISTPVSIFAYNYGKVKEIESLESGLVGHWKFDGDAKDYSGNDNNGKILGVDFISGEDFGKKSGVAKFDGIDDYIAVADSPSLKFKDGDFSISMWIYLQKEIDDVIGDLVTKYNGENRKGLNFYVKGSSGTYSSHGEAKNLHFGIDNAVDSAWVDCGNAETVNTQMWALTVFEGDLYTGMADAYHKADTAHVFKYGGGQRWIDCGQIGYTKLMHAVHAMIVHDGSLYAASSSPDWRNANPNNAEPSRVYKYAGGTEWIDCGQPGENYRIKCFASYKGQLYAGAGTYPQFMDSNTSAIYRYDGDKKWVNCGRLGDNSNELCVFVHNGDLYASGINDKVYRYYGDKKWTCLDAPVPNRQINALESYKGKLYVGTWAEGKVACYGGDKNWTYCGQASIGDEPMYEVQSFTVYNGKLYCGTLPKAEIFRYEDDQEWTMIKRLSTPPNWELDYSRATWNRAFSLTVYQGKLYATSSSSKGRPFGHAWPEVGKVYSMSAGANVSYDYDLGTGWKHVVAVREGNLLKLYLDGELISVSESFDPDQYDLSNDETLKIGFGSVDYFSGLMDEVRIYDRALEPKEVKQLNQTLY
jgi:hypothetical protein